MQKELYFDKDTPDEVKQIINQLCGHNRRVRLFFGNQETGRAWMEEYDVTGRIGRSLGPQCVPLLIHSARSSGGGAILTHCIVKIIDIDSGRVMYQHPNFSNPADSAVVVAPSDMPTEYGAMVLIDGEIHARFRTEESAHRWLTFMQGKRFSK